MAQTRDFPLDSQNTPSSCATKYLKTLIILAALVSAATCIPCVRAQLQQPLVFSSAGAVASRNDSPQTINLSGTANPAITVGPAPGGSTSATVAPGQTATYNLRITPGPSYTGTISLAYSGAPVGANIQAPSTVQISNGNAAALTVTVTTSGKAAAPPSYFTPRSMPLTVMRVVPGLLACAFLLLLALSFKRGQVPRPKCLSFNAAIASIAIFLLLGTAGCGGGSTSPSVPQTPQVVTPQGTSTITITPSAMSAAGKSLQLQPIQLTLTVN